MATFYYKTKTIFRVNSEILFEEINYLRFLTTRRFSQSRSKIAKFKEKRKGRLRKESIK